MVGAAIICRVYDTNGWEALFLAIAVPNIAGGRWFLTIDRSASDA